MTSLLDVYLDREIGDLVDNDMFFLSPMRSGAGGAAWPLSLACPLAGVPGAVGSFDGQQPVQSFADNDGRVRSDVSDPRVIGLSLERRL